jgi:hypothetical protein
MAARVTGRTYRGVRIELGPYREGFGFRYAFSYRGHLYQGGGLTRQIAYNAATSRVDLEKKTASR